MVEEIWIEEEVPVMDISIEYCDGDQHYHQLLTACKELGFFFIRNHGVSKELHLRKLVSGADRLFSSSDETKRKLELGVCSYTPRLVVSPFLESFKVSGPNFSASAAAQGFTQFLFGHQATEFSNLLDEYGSKMIEVSKRVVQLLLKILGNDIEKKFYDPEFSNCNGYLRISSYSCQDLNNEEAEVEALKKHTDISYVTILFQDDIGGLQMRSKGGEWLDVKPREDVLVVNIGDFMEAWSNGRVKSAEHRVVLRKNNVKRFSVAFFLTYRDEDKHIYAPSEVVGEGNSRLYRPFSTQQYRLFREKDYEKIGATLKDFARIHQPSEYDT